MKFSSWKRWLLGPNSSEVGIFSRKIRRKCPSEASRWNRVLDLLSEIPASLQVRLATTGDPAIFEATEIERKMGIQIDLLSIYCGIIMIYPLKHLEDGHLHNKSMVMVVSNCKTGRHFSIVGGSSVMMTVTLAKLGFSIRNRWARQGCWFLRWNKKTVSVKENRWEDPVSIFGCTLW